MQSTGTSFHCTDFSKPCWSSQTGLWLLHWMDCRLLSQVPIGQWMCTPRDVYFSYGIKKLDCSSLLRVAGALFHSLCSLACGTPLWDQQWSFGFLPIWHCDGGTSNEHLGRCGSSSEDALPLGDVSWLHLQSHFPHLSQLERTFEWELKLCLLGFRTAAHGLSGTYIHVWGRELEQLVTVNSGCQKRSGET